MQEQVNVQENPEVLDIGADTGTIFLHRFDEPANFYRFS